MAERQSFNWRVLYERPGNKASVDAACSGTCGGEPGDSDAKKRAEVGEKYLSRVVETVRAKLRPGFRNRRLASNVLTIRTRRGRNKRIRK